VINREPLWNCRSPDLDRARVHKPNSRAIMLVPEVGITLC
jgi:hypothetical protein